MTDLERFFRRMISNLATTDPRRLDQPVPLADVPVSIVPYRSNRRALGVETSEEYEMLLLRLCAGEGGFIHTEPEEVRLRFGEEVRSTNPDLEVLHKFEDVVLTLRPERLSLKPSTAPATYETIEEPPRSSPEDSAPEDSEPEDSEPPQPTELEFSLPDESTRSQCVYCGAGLPADRTVNFCPHCGQSQVAMVCPQCHGDVEPGWRHCVTCGVALGAR